MQLLLDTANSKKKRLLVDKILHFNPASGRVEYITLSLVPDMFSM